MRHIQQHPIRRPKAPSVCARVHIFLTAPPQKKMVRRIFPILQSQSVQGCKNTLHQRIQVARMETSAGREKKSLVRHEFSDICGCIVRVLHEPVIEVSTLDVSHAHTHKPYSCPSSFPPFSLFFAAIAQAGT